MSEPITTKLTPEQEAIIPFYIEKWRKVPLSIEPINPQKVEEIAKTIYKREIGFTYVELIFCRSPYVAISELKILSQSPDKLGRQVHWKIGTSLFVQLREQLGFQLRGQLEEQLSQPIRYEWWQVLFEQLGISPGQYCCTTSESLSRWAVWFDFCISVLNCTYDPKEWQLFQSLAQESSWIFPFEKVCYVCDRPTKLSFDSENRLHAEGEPAVEFADGYSLYCYHGVRLPEKYGKLHPNKWQPQWLLEEKNSELRRVLIQGIGYGRISQELDVELLDFWQDYSLLKIDKIIDVQVGEPIHLLKMTCPSTGFIHAMRVPPNIQSAREAIRWVNWGIDPEEFETQT